MKASTHLSCPSIRFTGLEGEIPLICPSPSLPIPRHSQPLGAASGCCLLHCLWRGAFTTTPSPCGSQCWRNRVEYPRAPVDQGSSLSPPHTVHALTPGAGQAAASFREGCAGMGRGWVGPFTPWEPREHPGKQS